MELDLSLFLFNYNKDMINTVKNSFTIQDLEVLTGIKAHTIRIWEKRYNILNPERLNRNVRVYKLLDLQKMLNISLLSRCGYQISKIALLNDRELASEAKKIALERVISDVDINQLIISMYSFDEDLFNQVYNGLLKDGDFESIFIKTFLPLLNQIGVLWQTESIKPAHEHFIANIIYQKIAMNTGVIENHHATDKSIYILFLPKGEIHELGLLFINYYLKLKGKRTLYLGRDIPFDDLFLLNSQFSEISWVCHFVVEKPEDEKDAFLKSFTDLLSNTKNNCTILGRVWENRISEVTDKSLMVHTQLSSYLASI